MSALEGCKTLSDLPIPTVLEAHAGKVVSTMYGKSLLVTCTFINNDFKRQTSKVHIPFRFCDDLSTIEKGEEGNFAPRVFVYTGSASSTTHSNQIYYKVFCVAVPSQSTVRSVADGLRGMTAEALERKLRIVSMSDFPDGTVFICSSLRNGEVVQDADGKSELRSPIMTYESYIDDKTVKGEAYIPIRVYADAKKDMPAILIYKGKKKSHAGRTYFDIAVLDKSTKEGLEEDGGAELFDTSSTTVVSDSQAE
jgi:hypothetical protein